MTATPVPSRAVSVAAPGAVTFPYGFKIVAASDLLVAVDGVTKTLTADYTLTGVGLDGGGDVTFVTPMVGGETVLRARAMAYGRDTDYQNLGDLHAATLNNDLDAPILMIQQLAEGLGRCAQLPPDSTANAQLPEPAPLDLIGWDETGKAMRNFSPEAFVAASTAGVSHQYTVAAGQVTLDVSAIVSPFGIGQLFYNGVFQNPDAYSRAANLLTFSEPLPAPGTVTIVAVFRSADQITDADQLFVTSALAGAVTRSLRAKSGDVISVKDFGAVGDGVADDTAAIQAALNSNRLAYVPPGKYRITGELVFDPAINRGCGLVGTSGWSPYSYTAQSGGPTWTGTNEAILFYDGPASDTTAMIRASSEAVGVEPASLFESNVYGFTLHNILLDGNGKAGIGVYGARLMQPDVYNVAVRGTTKHGWYINGNYSGRFCKIAAVFNTGCGISFGRGELDYAWTTNARINGTLLDDLYATANGADKAFNETTNPLWGYGIGLWLHRGNVVSSFISELNDGAGFVIQPTSAANAINSGYTEMNSAYSVGGTTALVDGRTTHQWGLWIVGYTGGASLGLSVGNVYGAGEAVRLTGTEPTAARPESATELRNLNGYSYLSADWGNYRLVNCASELSAGISGVQPAGAAQFYGGIKLGSGTALNVYSEGNFTPTLEGSSTAGTGWTYGINTGSYTRVGRVVHYTLRITLTAIGAGAAGSVLVKGLPFTARNSNGAQNAGAIVANNLTTAIVSASASAVINTSQLVLTKRTAASASDSALSVTDLSATSTFTITGSYQAA